jgi:hypothetical protein
MLEEVMKKLEFNSEDSTTKTALKGVAMGAIEGLVIVGALNVVANIFGKKK